MCALHDRPGYTTQADSQQTIRECDRRVRGEAMAPDFALSLAVLCTQGLSLITQRIPFFSLLNQSPFGPRPFLLIPPLSTSLKGPLHNLASQSVILNMISAPYIHHRPPLHRRRRRPQRRSSPIPDSARGLARLRMQLAFVPTCVAFGCSGEQLVLGARVQLALLHALFDDWVQAVTRGKWRVSTCLHGSNTYRFGAPGLKCVTLCAVTGT